MTEHPSHGRKWSSAVQHLKPTLSSVMSELTKFSGELSELRREVADLSGRQRQREDATPGSLRGFAAAASAAEASRCPPSRPDELS